VNIPAGTPVSVQYVVNNGITTARLQFHNDGADGQIASFTPGIDSEQITSRPDLMYGLSWDSDNDRFITKGAGGGQNVHAIDPFSQNATLLFSVNEAFNLSDFIIINNPSEGSTDDFYASISTSNSLINFYDGSGSVVAAIEFGQGTNGGDVVTGNSLLAGLDFSVENEALYLLLHTGEVMEIGFDNGLDFLVSGQDDGGQNGDEVPLPAALWLLAAPALWLLRRQRA